MASPRAEERGREETEGESGRSKNESDAVVVQVLPKNHNAEAHSRAQSASITAPTQETNSALTTAAQAASENQSCFLQSTASLRSLMQLRPSLRDEVSSKSDFRLYSDNYVCLVLTAAIAVAVNVTLIKILSSNVSVFQITAIRSFFCTLVLLIACYWKGISLIQPRHQVPLFLLRGIFGGFGFLGMALSTWALPLSASAFLANSYPVVTAVMSWLMGMEQLGALTWSGVFGCLIGNALIAQPPYVFGNAVEWDATRIIGIAAAFVSNLSMASGFLLIRYIGKGTAPIVLSTYMHFFSCLMSLPFLFAGFPLSFNTRHSLMELLCYGGTILLGVGLQLASTRALQIGPPTKVTSLFMMNMLLSGLIGVTVLHETTSLISGLGAVVTVVSVVVITAQTPKKRETTLPTNGGNIDEASNGLRSIPSTRPV